jgi:hypothetical protein
MSIVINTSYFYLKFFLAKSASSLPAVYPRPRSPPPPIEAMRGRADLLASEDRDLVPARLAFALLVHKDVPAVLQLLEAIYRYCNRIRF